MSALLTEYESAKVAVKYAKPEWDSYPAMLERRSKATKALLAALAGVPAPVMLPLDWRKPTLLDRENGHEHSVLIAPGHGGVYSIQPDRDNYILFRVDDPFAFDTFPSIEAAKAHAEADWQQTMSRKVAA